MFPIIIVMYDPLTCWSQWPRGLRRRSATARLLRSWVRIPPGAWMFVCCECCVLSGRGLCDELITRPEESYRLWCIVVWSRKPQEWGGHDPRWVAAPQKKKKTLLHNTWIPGLTPHNVCHSINPSDFTSTGYDISDPCPKVEWFESYICIGMQLLAQTMTNHYVPVTVLRNVFIIIIL